MIFPEYKVLAWVSSNFNPKIAVSDYYIISVQHLLESTGSLFESLIQVGFDPSKIFLTGKIYSTHAPTAEKMKQIGISVIDSTIPDELGTYAETLEKDVKQMWGLLEQKLAPNSKIIILDDGGYVLKNVPLHILDQHSVFGIEQTTSGIRMQSAFGNFPVIHLAASAAKVLIEPAIVSEAIQIRVGEEIQKLRPRNIGVIGYGNIGKAVTNEFKNIYSLSVFDTAYETLVIQEKEGIYLAGSIDEVYTNCDLIIGATGQDISSLSWLEAPASDKTLISISSGDTEFNRLLRASYAYLAEPAKNPLQTLRLRASNGRSISILRGGMVANFTGAADSSPGHIIQITRGLLFAAVIQIVQKESLLKPLNGPIMLDPKAQSGIVHAWFEDQPQRKQDYSKDIIEGFSNIDWIKAHSAGKFIQ